MYFVFFGASEGKALSSTIYRINLSKSLLTYFDEIYLMLHWALLALFQLFQVDFQITILSFFSTYNCKIELMIMKIIQWIFNEYIWYYDILVKPVASKFILEDRLYSKFFLRAHDVIAMLVITHSQNSKFTFLKSFHSSNVLMPLGR